MKICELDIAGPRHTIQQVRCLNFGLGFGVRRASRLGCEGESVDSVMMGVASGGEAGWAARAWG